MAPIQKLKPGSIPHALITTPIFVAVSFGIGYGLQAYDVDSQLLDGKQELAGATVVMAIVAASFIMQYLAGCVAKARADHGVPIPYMYPCDASKDTKVANPAAYMAVVRGHENFLEFLPLFFAIVLVNHLIMNESAVAAVFGFTWVFSRFLYAFGYASGNVMLRGPGFFLNLISLYAMVGNAMMYAIKIYGFL